MHRWLVLHDRYGQGDDRPWRTVADAADLAEAKAAVQLLTEAASKGHIKAQAQLAMMCEDGLGVSRSDALAAEWYRKVSQLSSFSQHRNKNRRESKAKNPAPYLLDCRSWSLFSCDHSIVASAFATC